ncbi:unnamed protein product [Brassica oleracea]
MFHIRHGHHRSSSHQYQGTTYKSRTSPHSPIFQTSSVFSFNSKRSSLEVTSASIRNVYRCSAKAGNKTSLLFLYITNTCVNFPLEQASLSPLLSSKMQAINLMDFGRGFSFNLIVNGPPPVARFKQLEKWNQACGLEKEHSIISRDSQSLASMELMDSEIGGSDTNFRHPLSSKSLRREIFLTHGGTSCIFVSVKDRHVILSRA